MQLYNVPEEFKVKVRQFIETMESGDEQLQANVSSLKHCVGREDWDTVIEVIGQLRVMQQYRFVGRRFPGLSELEEDWVEIMARGQTMIEAAPSANETSLSWNQTDAGVGKEMTVFLRRETLEDEAVKFLYQKSSRVGEED